MAVAKVESMVGVRVRVELESEGLTFLYRRHLSDATPGHAIACKTRARLMQATRRAPHVPAICIRAERIRRSGLRLPPRTPPYRATSGRRTARCLGQQCKKP
eukprot:129156-Prymnesium_polylepis.4